MSHLTDAQKSELQATAKAMITPGKGLLAVDQSVDTIGSRLATIGMENTEENRLLYRQLLFNCFTSDKSMSNYISGVIFFSDTFFQKSDNGTHFVKLIQDEGIIPGIRVDKGLVKLLGTDETTTQGLDDLAERCRGYYDSGARFAKWRCVLNIGNGCPSQLAIMENANVLARYASICQMNGLCPILEPEILTDGSHDLEACIAASEKTLSAVFKALTDHNVFMEGTILKPNMVLPGTQCTKKYTPAQVGEATITVFQRTLPIAVPGVTFLSGGQSEVNATIHLNAMNTYKGNKPWVLTFSFGRALQDSVLNTWGGKPENVAAAQKVFLHRAKCNSLAALGMYAGEDAAAADQKTFLHPAKCNGSAAMGNYPAEDVASVA